MIDKKTLLDFIAKAHRHTYAAPKEVKMKYKCSNPILAGHKDYHFKDEKEYLEYYDSYAGSVFAPGREVIFFKGIPIWAMSYQGKPIRDFGEDFLRNFTFPFLQKALMNFTDDMPFRGPIKFEDECFIYTFEINGDIDYFKGQEQVLYRGNLMFLQDVMGSKIK